MEAPVLKAARRLGVSVVSRLRKDSALWGVPVVTPGTRGRPQIYGENRISYTVRLKRSELWSDKLESSTAWVGGWAVRVVREEDGEAAQDGPGDVASGVIRVVLVSESNGWVAFFCTDASASVEDILGLVAYRFSPETALPP